MAQLHIPIMPNKKGGRDFVVGDIHGLTHELGEAMVARKFDVSKDRLFSVGDIIDRGPNSEDALKLLDEPWFFAVRGNHEQIAIEAIKDNDFANWRINGGKWAEELPYGTLLEMRDRFAELPYAMSLWQENGTIVGICHAEWGGDDWAEIGQAVMNSDKVGQMLWGRTVVRDKIMRVDKTAAVTIHGHTPVTEPTKLGTALFIDTAAMYGGDLSLLTIEEAIAIRSMQE